MKARGGFTLIELVITLALSSVIAIALGSVLLTHLRIARIIAARVAAVDAVRLALGVLPAELRLAAPGRDIRGVSPDSVAARLPRIAGVVCGRGAGRVWVRASGLRQPAADKDSVLFIGAAGEQVRALASVTEDAGPCSPGPELAVYRLDVGDTAGLGPVVVVFESGTYYLSARALRFRLGGEGRQPLTEELFQDAASGFAVLLDSTHAVFSTRLGTLPAFGHSMTAPASVTFGFSNLERRP